MIKRHLPIVFATMTAVGFCAVLSLPAGAQVLQDTQKQIAPGFNPDTGKINPGVPVQGPSSAPPGMNDPSGKGATVTNRAPPSDTHAATNQPISTPQEARAALLAPDSPDAAIGQVALPPTGDVKSAKTATGDAPSENAKAQQAENSKSDPSQSGGKGGETTGKAPRDEAAQQAARQTSPDKPIGSTTQTLPAKFSERNDVLARLPTMAWPLRLTDEQRGKIYQAVMGDKATASDLGELKPADQLPAQQALTAMHPLPQQLAELPDVNNIQFVKGKDKVFLVNPSTRIIVDVISN